MDKTLTDLMKWAKTRKGKKAMAEHAESYQERQRKEQEAMDLAVKQCIEACDGKARMDMVCARMFDAHSCPTLYIEWMMERFWGMQLERMMPDLERIYAELVKRKAKKKYDVNFNDADDNLWYIPNKKYKVIVHTGQSFNFLYFWEKEKVPGFRKLHIRKFYDKWEAADPKDCLYKFDKEEMDKFIADSQEHGYLPAIKKADTFCERYADDVLGNQYPHRLSLASFKKAGFEPRYGDGRDEGYIASWEEFHDGKVHWAHSHHNELKLIQECFIPSIMCELFDEAASYDKGEKGIDSDP